MGSVPAEALRVIRDRGGDSLPPKAFVKPKDRLDNPARTKIPGMSEMNDPRQGKECSIRFPGLRTVGVVGLAGTRKINPVLLIIAERTGVIRGAGPKPTQFFMIKPELGGRNAGDVNPAQFLVVDPGKMTIPKIPEPVLVLPRGQVRIHDGRVLPYEVEP